MKNIFKRLAVRIRKAWKTNRNKIFVIAFLIIGILASIITGEGTFLMFVLMFGLPVFMSDKDLWYKPEDEGQ